MILRSRVEGFLQVGKRIILRPVVRVIRRRSIFDVGHRALPQVHARLIKESFDLVGFASKMLGLRFQFLRTLTFSASEFGVHDYPATECIHRQIPRVIQINTMTIAAKSAIRTAASAPVIGSPSFAAFR